MEPAGWDFEPDRVMASTKPLPSTVQQLHESCDNAVTLTTADSDRFVSTQREIVSTMRGAVNLLSEGRRASEDFSTMVKDVQAWCGKRPSVAECVLCPRMDDILVVVVAKDEDNTGQLDDDLSAIDLEMFSRNKFRVSWLMLRASEASGLNCFVDAKESRRIYRAN